MHGDVMGQSVAVLPCCMIQSMLVTVTISPTNTFCFIFLSRPLEVHSRGVVDALARFQINSLGTSFCLSLLKPFVGLLSSGLGTWTETKLAWALITYRKPLRNQIIWFSTDSIASAFIFAVTSSCSVLEQE